MSTTPTLFTPRHRIPHGSAKAAVAAMKVGEPKIFPVDIKNSICSAAYHLGYLPRSRKIFGPGGRAYSIMIIEQGGVMP